MSISRVEQALLNHAPGLRAYITGRIPHVLKREIDVDDIMHDTWASVLRTHDEQSLQRVANLAAYLNRIAGCVLVDKLRAKQSSKRGGGRNGIKLIHTNDARTSYANLFEHVAGPKKSPSSEVATREAVSAIQTALGRIPDNQSKAITLYHIEGLSCAEVGKRMARSPSAIKGLLTRGLNSLRVELGSATRFLSDANSDAD